MIFRRKPPRQRDGVSFGRRTPRFSIEAIKMEVLSESELLNAFTDELPSGRAKVIKMSGNRFNPANLTTRGPVQ